MAMKLSIKKMNKAYSAIPVFADFDLQIEKNKITCILGPSGIGKTTLLNIICGLTNPDNGDISDFKEKTFSYIFQEPRLLKWKTVYENIYFVLKDIFSHEKSKIISDKLIDIVGLKIFKDYYPDKISGGMAQRVSIARAFAYPSEILLMDEPFKSLDIKLKKKLIDSFYYLWEMDKRTVIFVTHDIDEAAYLGDEIFILEETSPANIKKQVKIDISQKERLDDYIKIKQIKKTLIDSI
jgi:NitT/TauT family transport system ATP-binding protein